MIGPVSAVIGPVSAVIGTLKVRISLILNIKTYYYYAILATLAATGDNAIPTKVRYSSRIQWVNFFFYVITNR